MRRRSSVFLFGLFFCASGLIPPSGLFAEGAAPPGAGVMPVFTSLSLPDSAGRADELCVLQSFEGKAWLALNENGTLRIFRNAGEEGFAEIWPEDMPELDGRVRNLRLHDAPSAQYLAFICAGPAGDAVYLLGVDGFGELRCFPAEELRFSSTITDYALGVFEDGAAALYVLAEGKLFCTANAGMSGAPPWRRMISGAAETVDAGNFGVVSRAPFPQGWGWFVSRSGGSRELRFFALGGDQFLRVERAASLEGSFSVEAGTDGGAAWIVLEQEGGVSAWRGEGWPFVRERGLSAVFQETERDETAPGPDSGPPETWTLLALRGFNPQAAYWFDTAAAEIVSGTVQGGGIAVSGRRRIAPPDEDASLSPGIERCGKSLVINGNLFLAFQSGGRIYAYRVSFPEESMETGGE